MLSAGKTNRGLPLDIYWQDLNTKEIPPSGMMNILFRLSRHKSMTRTVAKRTFGYREGEQPLGDGYYIKQLYVKQETLKEFRMQVPGSREDFNAETLERIVTKCDSLMDKVINQKDRPDHYRKLLPFKDYKAIY